MLKNPLDKINGAKNAPFFFHELQSPTLAVFTTPDARVSLLHLICDSCRYKLKHKLHLSKTASGIFHFPLKTRKKKSMIICPSLNFLLANTDQDETIDFFQFKHFFFFN